MADLSRHLDMARNFENRADDAGRMARSFLAAMAENERLRARIAAAKTLLEECGHYGLHPYACTECQTHHVLGEASR